jgi:hypothetical protein
VSDIQPAPDWWQASDLKWYPPQQHPDYRAYAPAPRPPTHFNPKVSDIAGVSPAGPPEGYWQGTDGWWYPPESPGLPSPPKTRRPVFKRLWFWLLVVVLVAGGIASFFAFNKGAVNDITHRTHTIVYSATGTAPVAEVEYDPLRSGNGPVRLVRVNNASLPWSTTISTAAPLNMLSLSVKVGAGNTTCKITEDGRQLTTNTVSGASATADCSAPGA